MTICAIKRMSVTRLNGTFGTLPCTAETILDAMLKAMNHHGLTPASLKRRQVTVNIGKATIDQP